MNRTVSDGVIVEEAARWMALLHSGQASEQQAQALAQWRSSDARHEEIWQVMSQGVGQLPSATLRGVPRQSLLRSLQAPTSSRRRLLQGGLGLVALLGGVHWLGRRESLWPASDELQTGIGQRQALTLADGSALILNARTRVAQHFDSQQRLLQVHAGSVWLDVATDPRRAFMITTEHGQIQATGSRVVVARQDDATQLAVLHARSLVMTASGQRQWVEAGSSARFDARGVLQVQAAGNADAWTQGRLEARDWRLGSIIEQLRDYRPGIIRVSPQAAALRLSGIFPLDDSDRALQLLGLSLPIEVTRYSPYWVSIEVRAA